MIDGVDSNLAALNAVYSSMANQINAMTAQMLVSNADEWTGISAASTSLDTLITENEQMRDAAQEGAALISENQETIGDIETKVERILELANNAASGSYAPAEIADMQAEYEQIILDIDNLAKGELGEVHLLTSDDGSYEITISDSLTVKLDTADLTAEGLGIANLDLTSDAAGAQAAAQGALESIDDYADHLSYKADTVEAVDLSLGIQSTSYNVAKSTIDSMDAAWAMVGMLQNSFMADAHMAYIAQANVMSMTALSLLS